MFWKKAQLKKTIKNIPFQKIDPAFSECDHCVVFCADDGYMALTAVAIQSIVDHAVPEEFYDILVFHGGISTEHEKIYQNQWKYFRQVSIRFVNIAPLFDGLDLYTENRENFTREAYFRLATPWVLSERYTTALYLDGDMILRYDLSPIFNTKLNDNLLAAVKDYWGICNCYIENDPKREYRLSIGLDDIDHYVISATLLFNLAAWRDRFSLDEVIRLCASKKWEQHDQDVVNVLCQGSIVFLSPTWGMMEDYGNNHFLPEYMLKELAEYGSDPVIAHFGGRRKPHLYTYVNYDIEFWMCADKTPYMAELLAKVRSYEYRNYIVYTISRDKIETIAGNNGEEAVYKGVPLGTPGLGFQKYKVLRIHNEVLHIEVAAGYFGITPKDRVDFYLEVNGKRVKADNTHSELIQNVHLQKVYHGYVSVFNIPLNKILKKYTFHLVAEINGSVTALSSEGYSQYAELSGRFKYEYYTNEGWTIQHADSHKGICVKRNSFGSAFGRECRFLAEVFLTRNLLGSKKAVVLRMLSDIIRPFVKKPIWLISDRISRADDNGEVFYRYMKAHHQEDVKTFFLLRPMSPDYARMKELGGIIAPYSWRHKLLALLAEWSISSQTDYIYRDPFRDYGQPYRSLLRKTRFVFLQHGVISNDLSRLLDKDIQELDGFITSTNREYESVLKGAYHYTEEQVWLTGLPRFDRLLDRKEKIITVMPTWRSYLFTGQNHDTGYWNLKNGFEHTRYAVFYRNLMSSSKLREAAEENGYTIEFKVHPTFLSHMDAFGFDENVRIVSPEISYADIYSKSSLVVTDYSSSINDFIYLRKPIIYCHFDADEFFSGAHMCDKGEFDYERDGFGEVAYNLDDTIDLIIKYIKEGCMLHEPYKSRIEETFPDRNADHCEQIYQKIKSKGKY